MRCLGIYFLSLKKRNAVCWVWWDFYHQIDTSISKCLHFIQSKLPLIYPFTRTHTPISARCHEKHWHEPAVAIPKDDGKQATAATVVSSSEPWRRISQSAVFHVAAFSLFSKKICLLAVTNSLILRNKNSIPSLSTVVIALKMMSWQYQVASLWWPATLRHLLPKATRVDIDHCCVSCINVHICCCILCVYLEGLKDHMWWWHWHSKGRVHEVATMQMQVCS